MSGLQSTPISVVMIIQAYLPLVGGAEKQLESLAPLLHSLNIEITIITRRYPGLSSFEMIDNIPVYRLPVPGPKVIASLFFTLSALPIIKRLGPDIIHAHELLSPTTTAVAAKRLLKIPVVAKVLRGGELGDICKLNHRWLGRHRLKIFKNELDAFIMISEEIERELIEAGIQSDKRVFIPNGVDINKFRPVTADWRKKLRIDLDLPPGLIGAYVGRLSPEKQVDQVINIWSTVREKHPQANLVILGTGPEEGTLKEIAGTGIHFIGMIDNVSKYLQAVDFFVLPSSTEGLSNALLEAMSSGLPVIATRVGGAEELIEHQKTGLLIPSSDPLALLEALDLLMENQQLRIELGRKAREKIVKDFALEKVALKLRNLYERVIV